MVTRGKQTSSHRRSTLTIFLDHQMTTKKAMATTKVQEELTILASALTLTLYE